MLRTGRVPHRSIGMNLFHHVDNEKNMHAKSMYVVKDVEEEHPELLIDTSFWSAFYTLLHNVTHPHLPHPHRPSTPNDNNDDGTTADDTITVELDDDVYVYGNTISNDIADDGIFLTWSNSIREGNASSIAKLVLGFALCAGFVGAVFSSRTSSNLRGILTNSILGTDSTATQSGLVKRRFESFGQFIRGDDIDLSSNDINESGESQIEFVQIP